MNNRKEAEEGNTEGAWEVDEMTHANVSIVHAFSLSLSLNIG